MGFAGNDLFDGTRGINEVDYRLEARAAGRTTGMTIDLSSGDTIEIKDAYDDTDTLTLIERLRGTDHGDKLFGNNLNNRLRGDGGDDLVEGRSGFDRIEGGAGNDTLNGGSKDDTLLGDAGNDLLNGNDHNDTLIGGAGDDVFEGGEGNDVIDGGPMTETSFDELTYRNVETDGITVQSSTRTANSGTVTNDGSGSQDTFTNINSIVGTRVDDTFVGGIGNHRFVGLAGDDTFVGGSGNTEVDYRLEARIAQWTKGLTIDLGEDLTETVTVKDAMGGTDTLTNIKRIRGTDGSDTISGNTLGNRLRGKAGNDVLRGRNGDDALEGGAGTDTAIYSGNRFNYHVENNGTQLTITDQRVNGEGKDTVIDVEFFNFGGTILNLAEVINHGSAINLAGGMVFESSATGVDIGTLSVANPDAKSAHSYTLIDDAGGRFQLASDGKTIEVKNGLLLDYEQSLTHTVVVRATDQFGKSVDQSLTIVLQDVAKESTTGTAGSDTVSGGSGTDNLSGGGGNDNLNGGGGKDKINGGTGNDRIIGGTGQDSLTGGAGKDVFAFASKDTGTSKGTADFITDFSGKGGDRIDLKLIDADTKKKGDQAFSFIGKNAFTKAGQVRYEKTSKETFIYLNTDSDKAAEGVIKLKGAIDLQKGWFVL
jgi:Ca2+-binding RTX toxin-like protein